MEYLVWIGAALTVAGLGGLAWCIVLAMRARKAGLSDDEMRNRLQGLVALNLGALGLSALGLMAVVMGIALG